MDNGHAQAQGHPARGSTLKEDVLSLPNLALLGTGNPMM